MVDLGGPKEPCITWAPDCPRGGGIFGSFSSPLKSIVGHCCCVCSRKINIDISVTAAAYCIDLDWLVLLNFSPVKNPPATVIRVPTPPGKFWISFCKISRP